MKPRCVELQAPGQTLDPGFASGTCQQYHSPRLCCCVFCPARTARRPSSARTGGLVEITQTPVAVSGADPAHLAPHVIATCSLPSSPQALIFDTFSGASLDLCVQWLRTPTAPHTTEISLRPGRRRCKYQLLTRWNPQNLVVISAGLGLRLSPGKFTRDPIGQSLRGAVR